MPCLSPYLSEKVLEQLKKIKNWSEADQWTCIRDVYFENQHRTTCTSVLSCNEHVAVRHTQSKPIFGVNLRLAMCSPRPNGCNNAPVTHFTQHTNNTSITEETREDFHHYLTRVQVKIDSKVPEKEMENCIVESKLVRISGRRRFTNCSAVCGVTWHFDVIYSWQGENLEEAMHQFGTQSPHILLKFQTSPSNLQLFDESKLLLIFASMLLKVKHFIGLCPSDETIEKICTCHVPVFCPVE